MVTIQDALEGVRDILAEDVSEVADFRKFIRKIYAAEGSILSRVKKEFEGKPSKFEMYYDHKEPLKSIPSHRLLAMRRGEKEKVLTLEIVGPDERILEILRKFWIKHPQSYFAQLMDVAMVDGYNRLILPSIALELLLDTKTRADDEAILVFEKNLRQLLLLPPGGQKNVLGVDPGLPHRLQVRGGGPHGPVLRHGHHLPGRAVPQGRGVGGRDPAPLSSSTPWRPSPSGTAPPRGRPSDSSRTCCRSTSWTRTSGSTW